jgi:EmrB/QacA subfamily drug resistance transporter
MTSNQRLVLIASILGSFVAFLDMSVVNVALPAIRADLGGGISAQQWVVDAYLLTLGSLMLIAGSLSDLFGRRQILAGGLIGFAIASLACAIAPTSELLIVARGFQGIAGALLVPSSLALIISNFTGPEQGTAIGTWTAWTGISFVFGPLLGGLLVDHGSWRWIFAINVLPVAATLLVLSRLAPEPAHMRAGGVDFLGALLCALGLGGIIFGLIEQPTRGWGAPAIYLPVLLGSVALVCFSIFERFAEHPMLDLALFRRRNFALGNLATLAIYAGLTASTFLITVYLQQVAGYSATAAGLSLLPVTLIMFGLSSTFGRLAGKYGPRWFMAAGPTVAGAGFALMTRVGSRVDYVSMLLPGVIVFGLGLAMTVAPLTAAILGDVDERHAGIGSAINNAVARVAGLLAVAAIGALVSARFDDVVDERAEQHALAPKAREFVIVAKERPLVITVPDSVKSDADAVRAILTEASVSAFRYGIWSMAALLVLGGAISAVGIKNPKRR